MQSKNAHFMQLAGAEPCVRISSALAAAHDTGVTPGTGLNTLVMRPS